MAYYRASLFLGSWLMLLAAGCAPRGGVPPIPWSESFPMAFEAARASGKPMLVYFNAAWCGVCRRVERGAFIDPDVAAAMEAFVPVRIDVDRQPGLAQKYQIDAVPAYLKIDAQGKRIGHALGYKTSGEMTALLKNWSTTAGSQ